MNIGFVSAWYERGAAYVTKQYIDLLKEKHHVFVYARGGLIEKGIEGWNQSYVTWGRKGYGRHSIHWNDFKKWILRNEIEIVLFNEQQNWEIIADIKKNMPNLLIGAYIDYYRRDTVDKHKLYDFLICNTKRHYSVFQWHPQCYYVPWGTDTELFQYIENPENGMPVFFHSMGYSDRKGTVALLHTFLNTNLCSRSKLIIHTQYDYLKRCGFDYQELEKHNIQVIQKTVTAPGLYHMGDVYVYPAELDGLGLTIYEALSCGMPVIGTDVAPINEPINEFNGRKIKVQKVIAREDGYYWPLSLIDTDDLYNQMNYYIENYSGLKELRARIREDAVLHWDWKKRKEQVCHVFENAQVLHLYNDTDLKNCIKKKSWGQKIDAFTWYITSSKIFKGRKG